MLMFVVLFLRNLIYNNIVLFLIYVSYEKVKSVIVYRLVFVGFEVNKLGLVF